MSGRSTNSRVSGLLPEAVHAPVTASVCLASITISILGWTSERALPFAVAPHGFFALPWTPITSTFPHVNVIHLFFNLTWMWSFGLWLEDRIGSLRFFALYVVLALGSSAAEYAWDIGGVGLSGVVYGLFGFLWTRSRRDRDYGEIVGKQTEQIFVAWFLLCIALTWFEVLEIGNVAHGSGAVLGASVGWCCNERGPRRGLAIAASAVLLAACVVAATFARPYVNRGRGLSRELGERGYASALVSDDGDGLALCEQAVRLDPKNGLAQWQLGRAQTLRGSVDAGLASLRKADELGVRSLAPESVWLEDVRWRARRDTAARDWASVLQSTRSALAVEPRCAWAWLLSAAALDERGDHEGAFNSMERAYELEPQDADARAGFVWAKARRAWIAYEAGDVKTAREQMTRGLSLDPDQPQLRELRDRIGGGAGASR